MMNGFGMMSFFGFGMLLIPLLIVGLIVIGVAWLVKSVAAPAAAQPPAIVPEAKGSGAAGRFCQHCGKPLQADWKACPYCGEKV